MAAGRLRHKINIVEHLGAQNEFGELVENWTFRFAVRCNVKVLAGSELIKAGAQLGNEYISVLMRFDGRVNHRQAMEYLDNRFTIENIRPDDDNQYMTVTGLRELRNV